MSCRAIARSLKICRKTVNKYLSLDSLYLRKGYSSTNFDSFASLLIDKSNIDKPYRTLYQIIYDAGYTGAYSTFCKRINGLYHTYNINKNSLYPKMAPVRTWPANKLSFLLYLDEHKRNTEDKRLLELYLPNVPK